MTRVGVIDNFITSTIPEEWSALTDLQALLLFSNRLGGSLPVLANSPKLLDASGYAFQYKGQAYSGSFHTMVSVMCCVRVHAVWE